MLRFVVKVIWQRLGHKPMNVFLSYSHTDALLAAQVSRGLKAAGLNVWSPDGDLLPGDNWAAEVARALEESQAMVVLLTPDAMHSPWVKREMEYALGAQNYCDRLIPVVVGNPELVPADDVPWIVRRLPWVGLDDAGTDAPEVKPIADAIFANA